MTLSWVSSLTTALVLMRLALLAYCSVESDSSKLMSAGEMAASMMVLALPPNESFSSHVSCHQSQGQGQGQSQGR